ncbi:MAG TPA: glycoside hydrolase family 20 zincin-like fold domain-containing protein, partial [Chitinophagaceae bacterium]|nr:glycoside hydrolase family 20 zincin-like fold domain-containing protein [Chitinophagaceae bacterium]
MKQISSLALILFVLCISTFAQSNNIIPEPQQQTPGKGLFRLTPNSGVIYNNYQLQFLAGYMADVLKSNVKLAIRTQQGSTAQPGKINL